MSTAPEEALGESMEPRASSGGLTRAGSPRPRVCSQALHAALTSMRSHSTHASMQCSAGGGTVGGARGSNTCERKEGERGCPTHASLLLGSLGGPSPHRCGAVCCLDLRQCVWHAVMLIDYRLGALLWSLNK